MHHFRDNGRAMRGVNIGDLYRNKLCVRCSRISFRCVTGKGHAVYRVAVSKAVPNFMDSQPN